jgi:hypothetical protein
LSSIWAILASFNSVVEELCTNKGAILSQFFTFLMLFCYNLDISWRGCLFVLFIYLFSQLFIYLFLVGVFSVESLLLETQPLLSLKVKQEFCTYAEQMAVMVKVRERIFIKWPRTCHGKRQSKPFSHLHGTNITCSFKWTKN